MRWTHGSAGQSWGGWPAVLAVLGVVLVPTACVLWFMTEAVRNERLAVRQKLADVYQRDLDKCRQDVDEHWAQVQAALAAAADKPAAAAFKQLVEEGRAGSALIYRNGQLAYPVLSARDESERREAHATLRAIELMEDNDPRRPEAAKALAGRLQDYGGEAMPSAQRLFLMGELQALTGEVFATQPAEALALAVLENSDIGSLRDIAGGQTLLQRVPGTADIWMMSDTTGDGTGAIVALWRGQQIVERMDRITKASQPTGASVDFRDQEMETSWAASDAFLTLPLSRHMPRWVMSLRLDGADPFTQAARRQETVYRWTGGVGVGAIAVLGLAMGLYLRRQMRLARLKNDLTATVSHELKTPLASMRVLVDTLVEGRCKTPEQAGEYLRLIARENTRLSRLIDNFLTFSRMERNKKSFEFRGVAPRDVTQAAVEAMGERAAAVRVEMTDGLPPVRADRDALITVIVNLLDNACKYSGDDGTNKPIDLRAFAASGGVCIAVKDHGIGIARRHQRRIFQRFYQVDQRLSRSAGGCGLGLSIVRFIVEAHGGRIGLESQLGQGSTFTVWLPADGMDG